MILPARLVSSFFNYLFKSFFLFVYFHTLVRYTYFKLISFLFILIVLIVKLDFLPDLFVPFELLFFFCLLYFFHWLLDAFLRYFIWIENKIIRLWKSNYSWKIFSSKVWLLCFGNYIMFIIWTLIIKNLIIIGKMLSIFQRKIAFFFFAILFIWLEMTQNIFLISSKW